MANRIKRQTLVIILSLIFGLAVVAGGIAIVSKVLNNNSRAGEITVTTYSPSKTEEPTFTADSDITDESETETNTSESETTDSTDEEETTSTDEDETTETTKSGSSSSKTTYKMRQDMELILIMGVDDVENTGSTSTAINASQADVLYVLALDHKNKTYQTLQINRDTMTKVQAYAPNGKKSEVANMQICLAHSYGKTDKARCLNTVDAVSRLIYKLPIKHYAALNMSSISVLNDQVGGVTVTVPAGLEKADPAFVEGKTITLHGNQAELFVRSRRILTNDYNSFRMQRQEIFLKAWKKQALSKLNNDSGFAAKLILALSKYNTSDMSANSLSDLANKLKNYKDLGTLTPSGKYYEAGNGRNFREFHVNKNDLLKKVKTLCC